MEVITRSCCRFGEDFRNLTNNDSSTTSPKTHSLRKAPRGGERRSDGERGGVADGASSRNTLSMWINSEQLEKMCDLWLRTLQLLAGAGQSGAGGKKMGGDGDGKDEGDAVNRLVQSSYQCICSSIAAVLSLSGKKHHQHSVFVLFKFNLVESMIDLYGKRLLKLQKLCSSNRNLLEFKLRYAEQEFLPHMSFTNDH